MVGGGCNCGALRFQVSGEISDVFVCHCSLCRRFSGAAGMAVVVVENDRFRWTSATANLRCWQMPEHDWEANFCAVCGSAVPGANDADRMFVPAGAIREGGERLKVAHHIWVDSRAPWDEIGGAGKQHPGGFVADPAPAGDRGEVPESAKVADALTALQASVQAWEGPVYSLGPPADGDALRWIAGELGFALPAPYLEVLQCHDGAMFSDSVYFPFEKSVQVLALFRTAWASPPRFWPVGGDDCGNYYCLDLQGRVVFIDTIADPAQAAAVVAADFPEFVLQRVAKQGE